MNTHKVVRRIAKCKDGPDPYAAYLVYDTFTDDNAVAIADHTPEKDTVGNGWSSYGGAATISSNTVLADGLSKFKIDVGSANVIVTFSIKPTAASYARAECRYSAESDKISVLIRQDINSVTAYYYDPAATQIGTKSWSPTAGQWYDFEMSIDSANTCIVEVDGAEMVNGDEGGHLDGGTFVCFWLNDGWAIDLLTVVDAG